MLTIHTIIALAAIFNNSLYVVKPPHATRAVITFDYEEEKQNATNKWVSMDISQLDGIDIFKLTLAENVYSEDIITFKIKFYSNSFTRETTWQHVWNTEKSYSPATRNQSCEDTLIVSIIILCFLFVIYLLYFYLLYKYMVNQ